MNEPREEMEFPQGRHLSSSTPAPIPAPVAVVRRERPLWPRILSGLFVLGALGAGIFIWHEFIAGEDVPVSRFAVSFHSDAGHLNRNWFLDYTGLSKPEAGGVSAREVEKKLADAGQVRRIKKFLPHFFDDGLEVEVEERVPVFRYMYRTPDTGAAVLHLVDGEGVVYRGVGYDGEFLKTLPWLVNAVPVLPMASVKPVVAKQSNAKPSAAKQDKGIEEQKPVAPPRIPGVREMALLVDIARRNSPELFSQWETISAEEFVEGRSDFPGAHIRVRMRPSALPVKGSRVREIVFSADPKRFGFEFSAYTTPKVRDWVTRRLAKADAQETPLFDLCLFFEDRNQTTDPFASHIKQVHLVPVMSPRLVMSPAGQAGILPSNR